MEHQTDSKNVFIFVFLCVSQGFLTSSEFRFDRIPFRSIKANHHTSPFLFKTRPKPAFGRQGLDWDRWARIQFSQVHFGAKLD